MIAEVDPPKGVNLDDFEHHAQSLKSRVDTLAVTDNEHAVMRMAPWAPCHRLITLGFDPWIVLNARDRNRLSLQADLLGAAALEVRHVLVKEGLDPDWGDQPMVRSSGDLDMVTMVKCVQSLNNGRDLGGEELNGKPAFSIAAGLELSDDIGTNRKRADQMMELAELGVDTVVLGPTYDRNILDLFAEKAESADITLIATLMLLKSVAMIRYLNHLPGVPAVPHTYLKDMLEAPVKTQAGVEIAATFYKDLQEVCRGVLLQGLGWGPRLIPFLDRIGR